MNVKMTSVLASALAGADISVETQQGEVRLSVTGVKRVQNNLKAK